MGQHILAGNPPVAITLRQSPRARRISLRVSGLDGKVTLTIPKGSSEKDAIAFARQKESWLRSQLTRQPETVPVTIGAEIPLHDTPVRIISAKGRAIRLEGDVLHVPGRADTIGPRLQAWLKAQARDRLADASDRYAMALGRPYTRLTLRDTRSRWGSCSSTGGLMYSWRLIMAPPEVLDYVAAHEVAHLEQMNHSPAFWTVVAGLYPGYETPRIWLRKHGARLHRFDFSN